MIQAKKLDLKLNRRSDKTITDANYVSPDDLLGLKEGLADPPREFVGALKKLLKDVASEVEIDEYLVRPFRPKTRLFANSRSS